MPAWAICKGEDRNVSLLPDATPRIATHGEREASLKMRLAEYKYEEAKPKLAEKTKKNEKGG